MVKLKGLKVKRRDSASWSEPTQAEKNEALARRQERCPFDLTQMHEWPKDAFLTWGRWAIENDVRPDMDGDVDHLLYHARRTAQRHDGLLGESLDNFIKDFEFFLEGLRNGH